MSERREEACGSDGTVISVIVPFFNALPHLEACARSLHAQGAAFPENEVIFCDAASTDGSAELLRAGFPEFRVVRAENRNPYVARNHAARLARGSILAFTDADCAVGPEWMRSIELAMAGAADLVTGPVVPSPGSSPALRHVHDYENARMEGMCRRGAASVAYAYTNNFAVRADLFRALGGFDETCMRGGDSEFARRALASAATTMAWSSTMTVIHLEMDTLRLWWFKKYLYGRSGKAKSSSPSVAAFRDSRAKRVDIATLISLAIGRVFYDVGRLSRMLHLP